MANRDDGYLRAMSRCYTSRGFPHVEADPRNVASLGELLGSHWAAQFPYLHEKDPNEFAKLINYVLRDLSDKASIINNPIPQDKIQTAVMEQFGSFEKKAYRVALFLESVGEATNFKDSEVAEIFAQVELDENNVNLPEYIAQGLRLAAINRSICSGGLDEAVRIQLEEVLEDIDQQGDALADPPSLIGVQVGNGRRAIAVTQNSRLAPTGQGVITVLPSDLDSNQIRDLLAKSDRPLILTLGDEAYDLAEQMMGKMAKQGTPYTMESYKITDLIPAQPPRAFTQQTSAFGLPVIPGSPHQPQGHSDSGPLRPN